MTFQTLQNNDENRGKTKRANLIQEIRSTWLELAEGFQTHIIEDPSSRDTIDLRGLLDDR